MIDRKGLTIRPLVKTFASVLVGFSTFALTTTTLDANVHAQLEQSPTMITSAVSEFDEYTVSSNADQRSIAAHKPNGKKAAPNKAKRVVKNGWHGPKYFKNGKALTGRQTIKGKTYLFGKDGKAKKGLQTVGKNKQFYNNNYTQRKNAYANLGKQGVYYFNGQGNAISGVRKYKDRNGKVRIEAYNPKTKKQIRNAYYVVNKKTKYYLGKDGRATTPPKKKKQGPIQNGPYIRNGKPYGRPKLTGKKLLAFEKAVYNNQIKKSPDRKLRDPNPPREILHWKPGQSRVGKVDFGHKKHHEYNKWFLKYKNREITLDEFKKHEFNPNHFYIESIHKNRSKKFQAK